MVGVDARCDHGQGECTGREARTRAPGGPGLSSAALSSCSTDWFCAWFVVMLRREHVEAPER